MVSRETNVIYALLLRYNCVGTTLESIIDPSLVHYFLPSDLIVKSTGAMM